MTPAKLSQRKAELCRQTGCRNFKEYSYKFGLITIKEVGNIFTGYSYIITRDIGKTRHHLKHGPNGN